MREKLLTYVKCEICQEKLVSHSPHDYKTCGCENGTMVDGGYEYTRFGGMDISKVNLLNLYTDSPFEEIRELLARGGRGKDGKSPLEYVIIKDIDDDWLKAIIDYEETNRPNNRYLIYFKKEVIYRRDMRINNILK